MLRDYLSTTWVLADSHSMARTLRDDSYTIRTLGDDLSTIRMLRDNLSTTRVLRGYLYIVWRFVPGAHSLGSTQMLITADLPVPFTDSRARCSAAAICFGSRTSSP